MIAYKYLHPGRTGVLEEGLIRFTQSAALNDPFETTPDMRKLEQSFRGHTIRMIEQAELSVLDYVIARSQVGIRVNKHLAEFQRRNNADYAILSLSKIPNSLLMWAHYCDSHRGLVVGLDSTHAFFQTREFKRFSTLEEVHYSSERPVMPAPEQWDGSQEQIERALSKEDLAELLFYSKSEDWEYEQELRMIANPQVADRHELTPEGQDVYLYQFSRECLKEVIFGIRMPRDQRLRIRSLVRNRYEGVQLFEAVLSEEKFDVDINPFR
jgi:hypothetical protein